MNKLFKSVKYLGSVRCSCSSPLVIDILKHSDTTIVSLHWYKPNKFKDFSDFMINGLGKDKYGGNIKLVVIDNILWGVLKVGKSDDWKPSIINWLFDLRITLSSDLLVSMEEEIFNKMDERLDNEYDEYLLSQRREWKKSIFNDIVSENVYIREPSEMWRLECFTGIKSDFPIEDSLVEELIESCGVYFYLNELETYMVLGVSDYLEEELGNLRKISGLYALRKFGLKKMEECREKSIVKL